MEFSLTKRNRDGVEGKTLQFPSLTVMLEFITQEGEIDGWIIRVHHM